MPLSYTSVLCRGGVDLVTPAASANPGSCRFLSNYEVDLLGRYRRIKGYERFDGQPSPTAYQPVGSNDDEMEADFLVGSAARRALIQPVPGTGPVRGVFMLRDDVYALRDTADGLNCQLYQASASGWQLVSTPALLPGGRYHTTLGSFGGGGDQAVKLYGCDGVNPAFQFDGTDFVQLDNPGMSAQGLDKPHAIASHDGGYLFLAYAGGSLQYSAIGDPTDWRAISGAGEIALPAEINGLASAPGDALVVLADDQVSILFGRTQADWQLKTFNDRDGARPNTAQWFGDVVYMDETGLTRLDRVDAYGDFVAADLALQAKPLYADILGRIVDSYALPERNQYRLLCDNGRGLIFTFQNKDQVEVSEFTYHFQPTSVSSSTRAAQEHIYAGAEDGCVYRLEHGVSFDGAAYTSTARTNFAPIGNLEHNKNFKKLQIQVVTPARSTFRIVPDFDYAVAGTQAHAAHDEVVIGGSALWNDSDWDEGRWNAGELSLVDSYIYGRGRSIGVLVHSESNIEPPHVLQAINIHYKTLARRR